MEKFDPSIVVIYFGLFFMFMVNLMCYSSLRERLRRKNYFDERTRNSIEEIKRDILKMK